MKPALAITTFFIVSWVFNSKTALSIDSSNSIRKDVVISTKSAKELSEFTFCPAGSYVVGYQQDKIVDSIESQRLGSLKLNCKKIGSKETYLSKSLTPVNFGTLKTTTDSTINCENGFISSFNPTTRKFSLNKNNDCSNSFAKVSKNYVERISPACDKIQNKNKTCTDKSLICGARIKLSYSPNPGCGLGITDSSAGVESIESICCSI